MTTNVADTPLTAPAPHHKAAKTALIAFLLLATVVWIGVAVGVNTRAPGIVGLAAAIFGGLFSAVLTATIGGWIALKLAQPDSGRPHADEIALADPLLAPALAELDRLQRPIKQRRIERAAWRAPVGASIGVALWSALVLAGAPGGVLDFMATLLVGGLAGYVWTQREAQREAAEAYAGRPIEILAADAGGLDWRRTATVDPARLRATGVLRSTTALTTGGELSSQHAGASLRILPLNTASPQGGDRAAGFEGLLVEIETPGVDIQGMEQLAQARPGVIALIEQIATLPGLHAPTCAMADGRLTLAIPESLKPRVFDAPGEMGVRAAAPHLARIRQVIGAVLPIAAALTARG